VLLAFDKVGGEKLERDGAVERSVLAPYRAESRYRFSRERASRDTLLISQRGHWIHSRRAMQPGSCRTGGPRRERSVVECSAHVAGAGQDRCVNRWDWDALLGSRQPRGRTISLSLWGEHRRRVRIARARPVEGFAARRSCS
jgi:hypothetical protein